MMWREVKTNRNQLLWDKILWFCTAWRKINLPKLRTPTCSTPVVSMTTSPWGWSAPASWKSTLFRSISRTAPWPLAHTFTLVRSSVTACRRLCLQTSHPELRSALFLQLQMWGWLKAPQLRRSCRSPQRFFTAAESGSLCTSVCLTPP